MKINPTALVFAGVLSLGVALTGTGIWWGSRAPAAAPPSAPPPVSTGLEFTEPTPDPPPPSASAAAPKSSAAPARLDPLPPLQRLTAEDAAALDREVEKAIGEQRMPGAVVVVGRADGVMFRRAYGLRRTEPNRVPMTLDTLFDLASLTKSVATASAAFWLVEHEKLALEAPLGEVLSEFDVEGKRDITVEQLLLHTSGLPAGIGAEKLRGGVTAALKNIAALELEAPPGARYLYSDVGFIVLGALVERVARVELASFTSRSLWSPLQMTDTGFRPQGALRARAAPTTWREGRLLFGEVHDERAAALGGVAGHAGLFSTGDELARFARMLLGKGELEGVRVLAPDTVAQMTTSLSVGGQQRTRGWDAAEANSPWSPRAFGHSGFTGTSLWIDPKLDLFLVFLSSRLHGREEDSPPPSAEIIATRLRGLVAQAQRRFAPAETSKDPVALGIDVLRGERGARLRGARFVLLTTAAARARDGLRTIEVLHELGLRPLRTLTLREPAGDGGFERALTALGLQDGGAERLRLDPSAEWPDSALTGADALVIDVPTPGFIDTELTVPVSRALAAAERAGLRTLVLDRPNPLGRMSEGPWVELAGKRVPRRPGLTIGELASFLRPANALGSLEVARDFGNVEAAAPGRDWLWSAPVSGLTDPARLLTYAALAPFEAAGLSLDREGSGAFRRLGAPWIDAERLVNALNGRNLGGVTFSVARFVPSAGPHAARPVAGVLLSVTDPLRFRSFSTLLALARELDTLVRQGQARGRPVSFDDAALGAALASPDIVSAVRSGASLAEIEASGSAGLAAFEASLSQRLTE
jgi:CubicO group peptidase (beta-lactamase class C family)